MTYPQLPDTAIPLDAQIEQGGLGGSSMVGQLIQTALLGRRIVVNGVTHTIDFYDSTGLRTAQLIADDTNGRFKVDAGTTLQLSKNDENAGQIVLGMGVEGILGLFRDALPGLTDQYSTYSRSFYPQADNTFELGHAGLRWKSIAVDSATNFSNNGEVDISTTYSSAATSFTNVTGYTLTFTLTRPCFVLFHYSAFMKNDIPGDLSSSQLAVDGTLIGQRSQVDGGTDPTVSTTASCVTVVGLGIGTHTITLQAKANVGNTIVGIGNLGYVVLGT